MHTPPFVKLCSLVFAWTLLTGGQARATDYYISPAGSDANNGTAPNKAWQTIERANKSTLHPGDRVLFEGGRRFSGNLLITASGTKEAFIEIDSYGNGPATIQAGDSFGIRLLNCQYVKVRDLILAGSGVKPDGQTTNKEQGLDIYSTAKEGRPWQSIYADKLQVSGFRDGIVLHTPIGTQEVVGYNDVRVTHCIIKQCLFGGFYCWGAKKTSGAPWQFPVGAGTFSNCYLGDCDIHDNYSHDNEGSGFQSGTFAGSGPTTDGTIRYNVSENDAQKNPNNTGGIMTWSSPARGQIYNNTVFVGKGFGGVKPFAFRGGEGGSVRNNIFVAGHDGEFIEPGACSLQNNCYWHTNGDLHMAGCAGLADWQKKSGQEMLNGAAVGFQVDPRLRAPGSGGDLGDAARWKTLEAYNLLPSSPLIGKGLDLRDLFKISPGLCDFHGIPFRPIVRFDLGAVQSQ